MPGLLGPSEILHDTVATVISGRDVRCFKIRQLLLDEPLGALDALTRLEMQELIVSLWQEHGFTVLLVTHDVSEAVAMADRVLLIEDGKIGLDLTVDIARPRRIGSVRLTELEAEVLNRVMQRGDNEVQLRKQG